MPVGRNRSYYVIKLSFLKYTPDENDSNINTWDCLYINYQIYALTVIYS